MVNEILVRERLSPTIPPEKLCSIMQMWFLFSDEVLCSYILNITFYHGGANPPPPHEPSFTKSADSSKINKTTNSFEKVCEGW